MNNFEIVNPNAGSECLLHFCGMRQRRERLGIFIKVSFWIHDSWISSLWTLIGEEVGVHVMVLSTHFPTF